MMAVIIQCSKDNMASPRDYNTDTFFQIPYMTRSYEQNGNLFSTVTGTSSGARLIAWRVGTNTPNWRTLIRKRLLKPENPYSIRRYSADGTWEGDPGALYSGASERSFEKIPTVMNPDGTIASYRMQLRLESIGKANWRSPDNMLPPDMLAIEAVCRQRAVQKVLLALKDSKFNAAVAYNEAGQVQRLIGGAATKIARAYVDLRNGHLRLAAQAFGLSVSKREAARYRKAMNRASTRDSIDTVMSQGVLMVQYGIRPLLNDIVGAAELLAQKMTPEVAADVRASSTIIIDEGRTQVLRSSTNAYGPWTGTFFCKTTGSIRVSCKVQYTRGDETLHTISQLGLSNPALVAWEAMPWSFVIDWFIPVGNWISSLDATLGLTFKGGCITTKREYTHARGQSIGSEFLVSSGSSTFSDRWCRRETLTGFPSASLPHFKNPLSFEHALNGIALLVGVKNRVYDSLIPPTLSKPGRRRDYLYDLTSKVD